MAYYVYLDKMLFPIAPQKLQLKINNQNQTLVLINDGEINFLKKAKLTDVEFDVMIPQVKYPFAMYKDGFQKASYYLNKLDSLKNGTEPCQFIITRTLPNGKMLFDTNMKVSLEDYKVKEDAKEGFDLVITVSLKQYRDFGTKTCNITFAKAKPKAKVQAARPATTSPAPKAAAKTHTVVRGDCLWAIAQKYYGNGSRYPEIYSANQSTIDGKNKGTGNPKYTIYPGQVFTIPV